MPRTKEFLHGTSLDFQEEIDKAEHFRLRVIQYQHLHDDWVIAKAKELANKIVVDDIVQQMKNEDFSPKIWKATYLSDNIVFDAKEGTIRLKIRSVYETDSGFDVALAREHGTKRHFIAPRVKLALSWITQGVRLFSKGHYVSGIKSLHIIEDTVERKKKELNNRFREEYFLWKMIQLPEVMNPARAS